VTHALHFLHHVDYIYHIVDGKIVEQGSREQLMKEDAGFAKLIKEFSGSNEDSDSDSELENDAEILAKSSGVKKKKSEHLQKVRKELDKKLIGKATGTGKLEGRLMKAEKRSTGSTDKKGTIFYFFLSNIFKPYNI